MTDAVEDRRPRLSGQPRAAVLHLSVAVLFLTIRLGLLFVREPFFDELFTVWMARQPFSQIIPALLHDSGPPLYYFLARVDSVTALRVLSLIFACAQFVLVARFSWTAAALLAVYPPAALFAVDARAYALCGLFVTAAVLAMSKRKPYLAALLLVIAAYSHYYGVLFFPVLLIDAEWRQRLLPFLMALALFVPGFVMASQQPAAATRWIDEPLYAPLLNLSTAGRYPEALFAPAPWILVAIALALFILAGSVNRGFASPVLVPIVLAISLQLAGRPVYFPMRFEAVLAGPVVLWLWKARGRFVLPLALVGAYVIAVGTFDHFRRPPDSYREAAMVLKRNMQPTDTIVATGYCYLESVVALDRPVIAWPAEQAIHPGWRATGGDVAALPKIPFIWVGERGAPELVRLRGVRSIEPLFMNERALIALTRPLH